MRCLALLILLQPGQAIKCYSGWKTDSEQDIKILDNCDVCVYSSEKYADGKIWVDGFWREIGHFAVTDCGAEGYKSQLQEWEQSGGVNWECCEFEFCNAYALISFNHVHKATTTTASPESQERPPSALGTDANRLNCYANSGAAGALVTLPSCSGCWYAQDLRMGCLAGDTCKAKEAELNTTIFCCETDFCNGVVLGGASSLSPLTLLILCPFLI